MRKILTELIILRFEKRIHPYNFYIRRAQHLLLT